MSHFFAQYPMEDFFINPTMTQDTSMETFARISIMSEAPKVRFDGMPIDEEQPKTIRPVSTIQDLFLAHNFRTSYSSEEESASPRGSSDDNLSLHSDDGEIVVATATPVSNVGLNIHNNEDDSTIDRFLVPEELASSCTKIEHRCNRAQAVVLKSVGPKMISMPRLVDIPARPTHIKRPSNESFASTRAGSIWRAESRKSVRSIASTRPSHDAGAQSLPASLLPTPAEETFESPSDPVTPMIEESQQEEQQQQSPARSPIRNSAAFDSFPRLADIAAGNMDTSSAAVKRSITVISVPDRRNTDDTTPPMTPVRRRLHRLASTISSASDLVRRKSSISSMRKPATPSSSVAASPRPSLLFQSGSQSSPSIPRRSSSMGKLTPRGPTERAPILVLPPFPSEDDEDEDDDFGDASNERGLQKWDRPRARQVAKLTKTRPTIDNVVSASRA